MINPEVRHERQCGCALFRLAQVHKLVSQPPSWFWTFPVIPSGGFVIDTLWRYYFLRAKHSGQVEKLVLGLVIRLLSFRKCPEHTASLFNGTRAGCLYEFWIFEHWVFLFRLGSLKAQHWIEGWTHWLFRSDWLRLPLILHCLPWILSWGATVSTHLVCRIYIPLDVLPSLHLLFVFGRLSEVGRSCFVGRRFLGSDWGVFRISKGTIVLCLI